MKQNVNKTPTPDYKGALELLKMQIMRSGQKQGAATKPGDTLSQIGSSIKEPDALSQGVSGFMQGLGGGLNAAYQSKIDQGRMKQDEKIGSSIEQLLGMVNDTSQRRQALEQEHAQNQKIATSIIDKAGALESLTEAAMALKSLQDDAPQRGQMAQDFRKNKAVIAKNILSAAGIDGMEVPEDIQPLDILNFNVRSINTSDQIETINAASLLQSSAATTGDPQIMDAAKQISNMLLSAGPNSIARKQLEVREREAQQTDKRITIAKENTDIRGQKVESDTSPTAQAALSSAKKEGQLSAEQRKNALTSLRSAEDKLETIEDMRGLLHKGDVITGKDLSSRLGRIMGEFTGNKAYSDSELYDALSKGLYEKFAAFGNVNQAEFSFLTDPVPDSKKTKDALLRLLDRFERTSRKSIQRAKEDLNTLPSYMSQGPSQASEPMQAPQTESTMIKIKGPDGTTRPLPPEIAEKFLTQPGFSRA